MAHGGDSAGSAAEMSRHAVRVGCVGHLCSPVMRFLFSAGIRTMEDVKVHCKVRLHSGFSVLEAAESCPSCSPKLKQGLALLPLKTFCVGSSLLYQDLLNRLHMSSQLFLGIKIRMPRNTESSAKAPSHSLHIPTIPGKTCLT